MSNQVCVICGERKRSRKVSFFSIPKQDKKLKNKSDIELVQRRIAAWMAVIGSNINKYYGAPSVCSLHFHSGKPAYMFSVNDVDWVPSKNLTNTDQHDEQDHDFDPDLSHAHPSCEDSLGVDDSTVHEIIVNSSSLSDNSTLHDNVLHGTFQSNDITMDDTSLDSNFEHNDTSTGITNPEEQTLREIKTHFETFHSTIQTEKYPTDDGADLPPKRQKIGLSDSDERQNNGEKIAIEEPLKQKAVYCRPIQPMNGSWPRVTATIISPESINTAASINNLVLNECLNKPSEIVCGVSKNSQSITVKTEMKDFSIADEPDYDLHAAYCFTSKLTVERETQVTADEIRQAFQSTAATQTLWK